jgi:hypothetical protein
MIPEGLWASLYVTTDRRRKGNCKTEDMIGANDKTPPSYLT